MHVGHYKYGYDRCIFRHLIIKHQQIGNSASRGKYVNRFRVGAEAEHRFVSRHHSTCFAKS